MSKSLQDCLKPDIVAFHHPCPDGTACEIQVRSLWPDAVFVPYVHGSIPRELADDKFVTGQFAKMSDKDVYYHAALTDDIKSIQALCQEPRDKMEQIGVELLSERQKVAKQVCEQVEFKHVLIQRRIYHVAYVNLPAEKLTKPVADAFFATCRDGVSFVAMRLKIPGSSTIDFKLRRPPGSAIDLARLARCYPSGGGHVGAAAIQLPSDTLYLPDVA